MLFSKDDKIENAFLWFMVMVFLGPSGLFALFGLVNAWFKAR